MSPEQLNEIKYNEKSDIWSLGCLIYELAALVPPFDAGNQQELRVKVNAGMFKKLPSSYSEDLNTTIKLMLQQSSAARPSTEDIIARGIAKGRISPKNRPKARHRTTAASAESTPLGEPRRPATAVDRHLHPTPAPLSADTALHGSDTRRPSSAVDHYPHRTITPTSTDTATAAEARQPPAVDGSYPTAPGASVRTMPDTASTRPTHHATPARPMSHAGGRFDYTRPETVVDRRPGLGAATPRPPTASSQLRAREDAVRSREQSLHDREAQLDRREQSLEQRERRLADVEKAYNPRRGRAPFQQVNRPHVYDRKV
jgi:serine/threonine protein kinase